MDARKLEITGPCPIDLDEIGFDRRAKKAFCQHCSKNVVNLSNMTRGEARSFLRQNAGKTMCVSYAKEVNGTVRFQADPAPIVPVSRLRVGPSAASRGARAAGLALALAACTPHGDEQPDAPKVEMHDDDPSMLRKLIRWADEDPEPVPVAGAMEVPPEEMLDGEVTVPDPQTLDDEQEVEPCDKPAPPERPRARGQLRLPKPALE